MYILRLRLQFCDISRFKSVANPQVCDCNCEWFVVWLRFADDLYTPNTGTPSCEPHGGDIVDRVGIQNNWEMKYT